MKTKGFTLIEMIIVAAIFLIIFGAAMDFFSNTFKIGREEKHRMMIDKEVERTISFIETSLKNSWQTSIYPLDYKGSDGKVAVEGNSTDDYVLTAKGISMHVPLSEGQAIYNETYTQGAERDFKNNTALLSFRFNPSDHSIVIEKSKPFENDIGGVKFYDYNTLSSEVLKDYIEDFTVKIPGVVLNGDDTEISGFGDYMEIDIKVNYKGFGSQKIFNRDVSRTFSIYYNIRKE